MHEGHLNGKCLYMPILGQNLGSIEMKKKRRAFFYCHLANIDLQPLDDNVCRQHYSACLYGRDSMLGTCNVSSAAMKANR